MSTNALVYKELLKLWYKGEEISINHILNKHLSKVECNAYNTHLQEEKKAQKNSHTFGLLSFIFLVIILLFNEKTENALNFKILIVICIMLADTIIIILTSRIFKNRTLNIIRTISIEKKKDLENETERTNQL